MRNNKTKNGGFIMTYFTSDLHLGHKSIIKDCNRPFNSVEEMNETLINNFNKIVKENDTVYIVGDLFFEQKNNFEKTLQRLNGKKHLIIGNHDRDWMKQCDCKKYFESIQNMINTEIDNTLITLCHYPMMTWYKQDSGSYMVYGHIHNNKNDYFFPMLRKLQNALNAGVDVNNYRPVSIDELIENNKKFRE